MPKSKIENLLRSKKKDRSLDLESVSLNSNSGRSLVIRDISDTISNSSKLSKTSKKSHVSKQSKQSQGSRRSKQSQGSRRSKQSQGGRRSKQSQGGRRSKGSRSHKPFTSDELHFTPRRKSTYGSELKNYKTDSTVVTETPVPLTGEVKVVISPA